MKIGNTMMKTDPSCAMKSMDGKVDEQPLMSSSSEIQTEEPSSSISQTHPFPLEILRELRAGYSNKRIRFVINNGLFSDLYIYSFERLRGWYEDFSASPAFKVVSSEVAS